MRFASLLRRFFDRVDDVAIAREVRRRDAVDTGERISLDDLIRDQGFDPAELRRAADSPSERSA